MFKTSYALITLSFFSTCTLSSAGLFGDTSAASHWAPDFGSSADSLDKAELMEILNQRAAAGIITPETLDHFLKKFVLTEEDSFESEDMDELRQVVHGVNVQPHFPSNGPNVAVAPGIEPEVPAVESVDLPQEPIASIPTPVMPVDLPQEPIASVPTPVDLPKEPIASVPTPVMPVDLPQEPIASVPTPVKPVDLPKKPVASIPTPVKPVDLPKEPIAPLAPVAAIPCGEVQTPSENVRMPSPGSEQQAPAQSIPTSSAPLPEDIPVPETKTKCRRMLRAE